VVCWIGELAAQDDGPAPSEITQSAAIDSAAIEAAPASTQIEIGTRAQPFDMDVSILRTGGLRRKWRGVTTALAEQTKVLARCRANRADCPTAADKFLTVIDRAMTREGRARIGEINRSVNLLIRPADDWTQYGVEDYWASPLETFASGAGDCEDYAIAKYMALRETGISGEDLRLVVVRDIPTREYHAVAAVRFEGRWLILDNRNFAMPEDVDVHRFLPMFVIDNQGVKRVRRLLSPEPMVASLAPERDTTVRIANSQTGPNPAGEPR
jgi:predicted transglutaminase-like cysteine proteinase